MVQRDANREKINSVPFVPVPTKNKYPIALPVMNFPVKKRRKVLFLFHSVSILASERIKMKKYIRLASILLLASSLISCQYLFGDYRDKTEPLKPGIFMEIKLVPIDQRQSALSREDMSHIQDVMDRRINSLGMTSSRITIQGQSMLIEIKGYTNLEEARNVIGKTGELLFTDEIGSVIVSGKNIKTCEFAYQSLSQGGVREPVVQIAFDEEGTKLFANGTKANIGKNIVITLDETMLMAPKVNEAITDGKVVITFGGSKTEEAVNTAREMASILKGGSIPAKVLIVKAELRDSIK